MVSLPVRLRNHRKNGKPIATCLEAADYIEQIVGIERETRYFDIACSRIEAAHAQGRLFA